MSQFLKPRTADDVYRNLCQMLAEREAKKASSKAKVARVKSAPKCRAEDNEDTVDLTARWDGKPHVWTLDMQNKLRTNPRFGAPLPELDSLPSE